MILIDTKPETTSSSSPLNLSNSEEKPTLSFGELLKGVTLKKDDKLVQNGALVLSLDGEKTDTKGIKENPKSSKKETLLSLLKTNDKESVKGEPVELNPKITQNLSVKEIKTLIAGAKEYLKDKIVQSDEYKNAQVKELPKTLKGLSQLAQKIGIDISKITIEEVQVKTPLKEVPKVDLKSQVKNDTKEEVKPEIKFQVKNDTKVEAKSQTASEIKEEVKPQVTTEVKSDAKLKNTDSINEEVTKKTRIEENKPKVQSDIKELKSTPMEQQVAKEVKTKVSLKTDDKSQAVQIVEEKKTQLPKHLSIPKETPLFKAQTPSEHTTEQLVATKALKVEEKTPKTRADETLKLLLRGEKPSQANLALTADFSVATARVIAPTATSEATKSLESLLHGESSETPNNASKTDGLTSLKADSFEVKLNEAKQMIKYLSQDVKTAIEDYKSPFTRVKVQLNPQKLGEVDLTVVQRGKNLHISLSSNTTAINTLSMNANELRTQLNNNGINNASLNFNSQDSSNSQAGEQEQHRQKEQQANDEYSYFNNEEQNEEILSSLEIVVPNYA